jgi:hypothetical protein
MKVLIRIAALSLLMIPSLISAQEPQPANPFAGYWKGAIEEKALLIELRVQGEVVTGPIFMSGFGERYIRNGTVAGSTIQFTSPRLDLSPEDRDVAVVWTGQLTGDELSFSIQAEDHEGPVHEFVLTRRVP